MLLASTDRAVLADTPLNDWLCRLTPGRPSYECPNCKESAMQFFSERLDMPGRAEFFYCAACGSTWEM
jgi:DNA-directed RNA polymerase subunit M/transcription elongation factor TFIIS